LDKYKFLMNRRISANLFHEMTIIPSRFENRHFEKMRLEQPFWHVFPPPIDANQNFALSFQNGIAVQATPHGWKKRASRVISAAYAENYRRRENHRVQGSANDPAGLPGRRR
jgi:hypothetical protein